MAVTTWARKHLCQLFSFSFYLWSVKHFFFFALNNFGATFRLCVDTHSAIIVYSSRIPSGTSPELTALLQGLLRRNAKDRMEFDDFFNHPFIRKSHPPPATPPLPVPSLVRLSTPPRSSPPVTVPSRPATSTPTTQNNNAPTPEEADDFVLVPSPSQLRGSRDIVAGGINQNEGDTQPLPVPSQRDAFLKVSYQSNLEF